MYRKYTADEIRTVMQLLDGGIAPSEIARRTSIPLDTVYNWLRHYATPEQLNAAIARHTPYAIESLRPDQYESYSYALGMYLGDGYISHEPRTFKLRISLNKTETRIADECARAIQTIMPGNRVNVVEMRTALEVTCYSNHWPVLFPQHGEGRKHTRKIELEDWQKTIVEHYPEAFLRGCIHSDGSRHRRIVKGKDYPAYGFCNTSEDILQLFMWACDLLCIHYTRANAKTISIARRADVARLDEIVGAKT